MPTAPASLPQAQPNGQPTPADLAIRVRDLRFDRSTAPQRWWLGGNPVATAWHNALSATFPRGEAFFIEAVKAHRKGAPPALAKAIRAFIAQEVNHSREHLAFNRLAAEAGYDLTGIDQRVADLLALTRGRPAILNLATTIALEHFTAMLAHDLLARPAAYAGADPETMALWRWHAIEEVEHKGVAFDTWLHATQGWSRWRRWRLRCLMLLLITRLFIGHRITDTLDLLAQDGITGAKALGRVLWWLFGSPGVLRRVFPAWASYFRPGFHPWRRDDRALIAPVEDAVARAAKPAGQGAHASIQPRITPGASLA